MGKKKKVTIGYRYFMGIHAGLSRGPLDEIVEIRVGDKTAWQGSITSNAEININQPDMFGGEEKEGGIVGTLAVLMGAPEQSIHARLATMLGGIVPAFRGVASTFFDGMVCAMSAYPKPWSYRVRRITSGWDGECWYPAKALIALESGRIRAMNPAHILWQVYTNKPMGRGLPAARLDDAAWRAAADTLHAEGFGLCLKWTRQDSVESFCQQVVDHIGAAVFTDRKTGLLSIKLIRGNYNINDLPLFSPDSGLLGVDEDDAGAQTRATNELIVSFVDPLAKEKKSVRVKNPAAIHSAGGAVNSASKEYPGIPTASLALRVAQRDLQANSGFIKRFKVRLDRRGGFLDPGAVFRISDPSRGIAAIVVRAGRCEYGTSTDGTVTVTAVQDVFGLPATSYVAIAEPGYQPPAGTPLPIVTQRLMEASYREIVEVMGNADARALDVNAGFLLAMAAAPSDLSQGFVLQSRVGSAAYVARGDGAFCPTAVLASALSVASVSTTLIEGRMLASVQPGQAALIDNEVLCVTAINPAAGTVSFSRGCVDTVPAAHAVGSRVWFYDDFGGHDPTEYVSGMTVQARLLTRATGGVLPEASATALSLALSGRAGRPYPPGKLRINGAAFPATFSGQLTVSWAHRDRLTQADQLIDESAGNIGPEPGVTYRLRIYGNGTLRRTFTDLTGTSQIYTSAQETTDGGPFTNFSVFLDSVRNGIYSAQAQTWAGSRG